MSIISDAVNTIYDYGFSDISDSRMSAELDDSIQDFCSRHPWKFLEGSLDLTFDGTSATASNWPSNVRAVISFAGANGVPFDYVNLDSVDKVYGSLVDSTGYPIAFYTQGSTFNFLPIPTADVQIRMRYIKQHPTVTTTTADVDLLIPRAVIGAIVFDVLSKLYLSEDDGEMSDRTQARYDKRIATVTTSLELIQFDGSEAIIVTDPFESYGYDLG